MKIAVVGGVAAGTSAAAKARRTNDKAEIVLFEKGEDISYAGCGLPYYISGVTEAREKVVINIPEEFADKYGVNVKTEHEVTDIDKENKTLKYNRFSLCFGFNLL
jgi:NADPH-dependent 2,4-dienoyl-CoA reductase/sulfur reductase-like enzyme